MTARELEQLRSMYVVERRSRRLPSSESELSTCSSLSKWIKVSRKTRMGYRCASCPYFSERKSNVGRHFDRKHIELKKPKKCSICSTIFMTKGEYLDHTERHHRSFFTSSSISDELCDSKLYERSMRSGQSKCMKKMDQDFKMDLQNNNHIYTDETFELDYHDDSESSSMDENSCADTNQLSWNFPSFNSSPLSKKYKQAEKDAVMALLILHCPDYYLRHQDSW